jgi:ribonuclease J
MKGAVSSRPGPNSIQLLPLGGLGEIGMNCLAIEQHDGVLVVDCGTSFPHDDLGVDVIHPDFSALVERRERIAGVFITHGHEDHIGALSFLLNEIDVPVWGPSHALALSRRRLVERGFHDDELNFRQVGVGTTVQVGPFVVEPVRVSHSIVEATALCIRTAAGTVLHTGDFNMDPDPPDGEPIDLARLEAIGDEGVELLLSDSTNIDVPERPGSERQVGKSLGQLIAAAERRVFVVMFASNIQRLMLLGEIAQRTGRKICLLGRSLNTQVEVAREVGRLSWPSNLRVAPEQALELPPEQVLVLAGGSQAEPNSAMRKLASGVHSQMSLSEGDSVVFSSRIIPGNERAVFEMICDLIRRGARLHTRVTDPDVHTSGHGGRSEQRRMLELIRPRAFLPVHGTLHHLVRHAELAREVGVEQVLVAENGQSVAYQPDSGLEHAGMFSYGRVRVSPTGERLEPDVLRRRSELARYGLCVVSVALDGNGRVMGPPQVSALGLPNIDDSEGAKRAVAHAVADVLSSGAARGAFLEERVRRAVRRVLVERGSYRPNIEVHVLSL